MNCLIDGQLHPGADVDPAKHRYIGMFRPAWDMLLSDAEQRWEAKYDEHTQSGLGADHQWALEYTEIKLLWAFGNRAYMNNWKPEAPSRQERLRSDYMAGHFDIPQYQTIGAA